SGEGMYGGPFWNGHHVLYYSDGGLLDRYGVPCGAVGGHGRFSSDFRSNWWMTCSSRPCISLSIAKVSSPYSWPRAQRTIAVDTTKLGWSGKVTVKEHICPTCNGTSPESFHPFTEKFHRVPWPWIEPAL